MKFTAYERYAPSESVWLDQLPDHWKQLRVKHVIERMESGVSVNSDASPAAPEEIGVLKTSCVYGDQFSPNENKRVLDNELGRVACHVKANRLIISRMNTPELVGSCGYVERDFPNLFLPDRLWQTVFSKSRECLPRFAWYYLTSRPAKSAISSLAAGTSGSMQNIGQDAFVGIGFPLPPLDEQQTIARFLDTKTAQIDALVAQKRQLIAKLKEKRGALIARTITRGLPPEAAKAAGLEPNPEMKDSRVEWLGQIPVHWTVKAVRYIFRNCDSRRIPLSSEERADLEKLYPYYGASGVIDMVDDYLFDEPLILVAEDGANLLSRSTPLAFLATGKYWVNNHAHILKPLAGDIRYWVATLETFDFSPLITGAAQPKLTADRLAGIQLPVPPAAEQTAIADYLMSKTSELDDLVGQAATVIDRLAEYRQSLITSAVTGKIDVRGQA